MHKYSRSGPVIKDLPNYYLVIDYETMRLIFSGFWLGVV